MPIANHTKSCKATSKQEENGRRAGVQGFGKDKGRGLPICHRPLLRTSACLIIDERRRLPGSELSELFRSVGPCPGGQPHYWTMRGESVTGPRHPPSLGIYTYWPLRIDRSVDLARFSSLFSLPQTTNLLEIRVPERKETHALNFSYEETPVPRKSWSL